jgi:hypothetical protein
MQAWWSVNDASEGAPVWVRVRRAPKEGVVGAPGRSPYRFRHARVRQIVRQTKSMPLAQMHAGWSRLQLAYLPIGVDEARALMHQVDQ